MSEIKLKLITLGFPLCLCLDLPMSHHTVSKCIVQFIPQGGSICTFFPCVTLHTVPFSLDSWLGLNTKTNPFSFRGIRAARLRFPGFLQQVRLRQGIVNPWRYYKNWREGLSPAPIHFNGRCQASYFSQKSLKLAAAIFEKMAFHGCPFPSPARMSQLGSTLQRDNIGTSLMKIGE